MMSAAIADSGCVSRMHLANAVASRSTSFCNYASAQKATKEGKNPVDILGVNIDKFDDKYFAKKTVKRKKKENNVFLQEMKDDQKTMDAVFLQSIEGVSDLKAYLGARFSLKAGMKPHELVF
ncbi:60S ribosomal protein L6-like [Impatiens glandulifera]|uniref:60S ribosomal protein L6-like n=1 Tax=Impatiens glandulifera TaxID=253017 RepID=UPI001FB08DAF|nr:60S ribosomal protein L6-like [Impatiens glandulifera]